MHDSLAHLLQQWPRALEGGLVAPNHESEGSGLRTGDAPGHRGVEHREPIRLGGRGDLPGGVDVNRGAIDQQRAGTGALHDPERIEIHLAHLLAGRQHGDDHVGARGGDFRCLRARAAGGDEVLHGFIVDVAAFDLVPGLEQVLRHRQTHIAEPNEADACHRTLHSDRRA
jgi:hypothetical protein